MATITELTEMVESRREMLETVIEDRKVILKILDDINKREQEYRERYHYALSELDALTHPGRRFR